MAKAKRLKTINDLKPDPMNVNKGTERGAKVIDWREFTHRAIALFAELGAKHYVKKDLQPFLPDGYSNSKYVNQFQN